MKGIQKSTICEFKGTAKYYDIIVNSKKSENAAWSYHNNSEISDYIAFYAKKCDACYLDDEKVTPQEGPFYGGWISSHVVGPFKGPPGTEYW